MKNIFQDDTLPSGTDLPPMPKNDSKNMPSRPKPQVTPPPMKQAMPPQTVYVPVQPTPQQIPAQPVAPVQGSYQYIPVNPQYPPQAYSQQGVPYYPVFGNNQQPVYPQGVPYAPYPAYTPTPAPEQEEPKNDCDPGTRVLFQSPDFENKDGSSTTIGYPTDWLIEVGYGQSSLDDIAMLNGETVEEVPAETEAPATEAPATEAPKVETEPAPAATTAPAVNTETSNSNALILGVLAVAAVAVVAFVVLKKKK